jgi:glycosyltransferase involved in cell wall biosynthesis
VKIAIVVPYFTPYVRGNEYGLADGLTRLGEDVTILASTGKAPREKMVKGDYQAGAAEPFKVRYLPTLLDVGEIPFTPTIVSEVLGGGYDVLLLQEDYQPICHLACLAAKLKGIPTVLSTERTHFPAGVRRAALKAFDLTLNAMLRRSATAYTAHDRAARDFVERELRVPPGRVSVLPVGVDARLFQPAGGPTPLTEGDFKVLTVARLHPYKGLEHLIRAMKIVREHRPGAVLYIMGRGPSAPELKALAAALGLEGAVRFIESPVPNPQMPPVYTSCDLYVQPSVVEPYGIAVLEAMACGRPAVCSRVGGMMDTVEDGVTGFLVPPADPRVIAEKVLLLASDRKWLAGMGAAARRRAEEHYDWPAIARRYLELIGTLKGR